MAEASNGPLATSETKEFGSKKMSKSAAGTLGSQNSGHVGRRSSTGSCDNGAHTRRYSSEEHDSANISQRRVPHYLRTSTGSCHDICKYGRNAFEEEARKSVGRKIAKPSLIERSSTEITVPDNQKREMVVEHKPSADTEKRSLLLKPSPDAKSFSPKIKASSDAKTHIQRQNASSSGKIRLPNSPTDKSTSSAPLEFVKREILPPKEVDVAVVENYSIGKKMSRTDKKTYDQYVKDSSSVRSKPVKVKSSSASINTDEIHRKGRGNNDVQTGRKMRTSVIPANKTLLPAAASLLPKSSLSKTASSRARKSGRVKLLSTRKDQSKMDMVETETSNSLVPEKTLHVIKTGTKNDALESIHDYHAVPAVASTSSPEYLTHTNSLSTKRSQKTLTGKNVLESISDGHAFPSLPYPPSPKSLSPEKPPSLSYYENEEEKIKYSGNVADEFFSDNILSMEIDKVQMNENENKTLRMGTENNEYKSIQDDHAILALPSPSSSKSLSQVEDDEEINHTDKEEDKLISGNTETEEISKAQPPKRNNNKNLRKNRAVSSGDRYYRPVKLKFRSGKVLDLHQNNNVPIRLRFRRTKVSGNNGKKADDFVSDNGKSVENGYVQDVKKNNKTLKKSMVVVSEDKSRSPAKLLRSEKLADLQSDNNIPRRLRFRRARTRGVEDDKGDLKRIFKKAGGDAAGGGADLSSPKVNLKHQDLKGKKDAQPLFNNVIEETASKLVESRKSKVKALVGAFETVISLQECKPSLRTVS